MAYLEELLPEFRNGAKIRSSMWSKKAYIHLKDGKILDESGLPYTILAIAFRINDWELYQEPIDWDYIIKNKCLCWFWDHSEERKRTGLLARLISQDKYRFEKGGYNGEPSIPYMNCRPIRKDEVTF
nr:MAG TPA: hypothetical protein [Caudoviricetes sp.]